MCSSVDVEFSRLQRLLCSALPLFNLQERLLLLLIQTFSLPFLHHTHSLISHRADVAQHVRALRPKTQPTPISPSLPLSNSILISLSLSLYLSLHHIIKRAKMGWPHLFFLWGESKIEPVVYLNTLSSPRSLNRIGPGTNWILCLINLPLLLGSVRKVLRLIDSRMLI